MNQDQKRRVMALLDEYGDARYWVGRYAERGNDTDPENIRIRNFFVDDATKLRNEVKELLFPVGA